MNPPYTPDYDGVRSFLADWTEENGLSGVAVSIADGEDRFIEGYGHRGPNTRDPVTGETLFCLGSCTKLVTAAAVLLLAEDELLSLSDEVAQYVPWIAETSGPPIMVEDLLTHSSSVPSDGISFPLLVEPLLNGGNREPFDRDDFERHVRDGLEDRLPHRSRFMYYNTGYSLLGQVIEAASGSSYAEFVDTEILSPLGMDRSGYRQDVVESRENMVETGVEANGNFVEREFPFNEFLYPSGGLFSSVAEFLRLVKAVDGSDDSSRAVFSAGSKHQLSEPRAEFGRYFDNTAVRYGLGIMRESFLGQTLLHHGGTCGISSAWFGMLRPADIQVVLCCGTEPEVDIRTVGKAVLAILLDAPPDDCVQEIKLDRELAALVGTYESRRGFVTAVVDPIGGGLHMQIDEREFPLVPVRLDEDAVFSTVNASGFQREVRFERTESGTRLLFERYCLRKTSDF